MICGKDYWARHRCLKHLQVAPRCKGATLRLTPPMQPDELEAVEEASRAYRCECKAAGIRPAEASRPTVRDDDNIVIAAL